MSYTSLHKCKIKLILKKLIVNSDFYFFVNLHYAKDDAIYSVSGSIDERCSCIKFFNYNELPLFRRYFEF